jgi:hypothetical protein
MHVFTQDHNGGGYEGILSTFQKRVMQERCIAYAEDIVHTTLDNLAKQLAIPGSVALAFNPDGQSWSGVLHIQMPRAQWDAGERLIDNTGAMLPVQVDGQNDQQVSLAVLAEDIPPVGYRAFAVKLVDTPEAPMLAGCSFETDGNIVVLRSPFVAVAIDRLSGSIIKIEDLQRGSNWTGEQVGKLAAYKEIGSDVTLRLDETAPPIIEVFERIDEPEVGPLFARIRIHKRMLDAAVVQTITVWAHTSRVDLQTQIRWWGAHNLQLRQALPSVSDIADIAYGTPFYGSSWASYVPDAAPRNPDEILVEDYHHYREVQGWLHLRQPNGGMTIVTTHPGFYHDHRGLQAVLMRTSPSCGDHRLFWENAGQQQYQFVLLPGDADWRQADSQRVTMQILRPPVVRIASSAGDGSLAANQSFLRLEGEGVQLSAAYPSETCDGVVVRIVETKGATDAVSLSGPLVAENEAFTSNLLEEDLQPIAKQGDGLGLYLEPWRIQTILLTSKLH